MKIKVSELTAAQLNWAVGSLERWDALFEKDLSEKWRNQMRPKYCTDWSEAGPIIEREKIDLHHRVLYVIAEKSTLSATGVGINVQGSTPLEAAMRCYVSSKSGDSVEIPEELL